MYKNDDTQQNVDKEWDLLSLIYETADDPGFWPLALEGLKAELDSLESPDGVNLLATTAAHHGEQTYNLFPDPDELLSNPALDDHKRTLDSEESNQLSQLMISDHEMQLINKLRPHFKRAMDINRHRHLLQDKNDVAHSLLDRLPIGIIFTDICGKVISQNSFAQTLMERGIALTNRRGYIQAHGHEHTQQLLLLIGKAKAGTNSNNGSPLNILQLPDSTGHAPLSIMITPHILSKSVAGLQTCVALFIATSNPEYVISEKAIAYSFGLSVTEASLAKHIASGKSLARYCEKQGVTQHTARSQLKSIYNKTGIHSQNELIKKILTSPAIFVARQSRTASQNTDAKISLPSRFVDDKNFLRLPDGRTLCYADVGNKNGLPVVILHGSYGCRFERHHDDQIANEMGIRLIVPDRPGFGLSTSRLTQMPFDWCDDFTYLLDYLNIKKAHLLSTGSGSYFSLACAYLKSNRVASLSMINAFAPFESVKEISGAIPYEKLLYALARHTPILFRRLADLVYLGLSKNLDWYFHSIKANRGNLDAMTLSEDISIENIKKKVSSAYQNSRQGFIQETILLTNPWQFDLTKISAHAEIHSGGDRNAKSTNMGAKLASLLPNNNFHYYPKQDTYLIITKWRLLLSSIKKYSATH